MLVPVTAAVRGLRERLISGKPPAGGWQGAMVNTGEEPGL